MQEHPTARAPLALVVALALACFAANSLLCRIALATTGIDASSFTLTRMVSGAVTLGMIVRLREGRYAPTGSWASALALFGYAAAFSFAYTQLPAATGALLLFAAVQVTMIGAGLAAGERLGGLQWIGFALAISGLLALLWPGLAAPPPLSAALMLGAGVAWGVYSLRGRRGGDPTLATAGNFLRAVPFSLLLSFGFAGHVSVDPAGLLLALASGALASGVGYAIWYSALPRLARSQAATLQLCVPVLATLGGVALLGEPIDARIVLASVAILGGVATVVLRPQPRPTR